MAFTNSIQIGRSKEVIREPSTKEKLIRTSHVQVTAGATLCLQGKASTKSHHIHQESRLSTTQQLKLAM
jgi:hypothetical protein